MRVRAMDANGDARFGHGQLDFLADSPEAVAQLVGTRLRLSVGEWFLDVSAGMPWATDVLGVRTAATRDQAIRQRILGTAGVNSILSYASSVTDRAFRADVTIDTTFGSVTVTLTATPAPVLGGLDFRFASNSDLLTLI
ncbi:MAG: hypothetical protein JWQ97_300 [Phenylobacterium sp.]|nr:hypothetical protein [Phenylobacterium sp.]